MQFCFVIKPTNTENQIKGGGVTYPQANSTNLTLGKIFVYFMDP